MSNLAAVPDGIIIRRSLRDPQAFAELFERHFDALYSYARHRVGSDLAEEIVTETFVRAFDRRRRFRTDGQDARPWLLGIAANLLRRHWRTERRRIAALGQAGGAADSTPPRFATASSAELLNALDTLSKDDRETLFLFSVADLSYEEIADALGIPVGTVRSRLARARARLRKQLAPTEPSACDPKESFNV